MVAIKIVHYQSTLNFIMYYYLFPHFKKNWDAIATPIKPTPLKSNFSVLSLPQCQFQAVV